MWKHGENVQRKERKRDSKRKSIRDWPLYFLSYKVSKSKVKGEVWLVVGNSRNIPRPPLLLLTCSFLTFKRYLPILLFLFFVVVVVQSRRSGNSHVGTYLVPRLKYVLSFIGHLSTNTARILCFLPFLALNYTLQHLLQEKQCVLDFFLACYAPMLSYIWTLSKETNWRRITSFAIK